ncbi:MAG: SpoIIE family protein phosphatase [Planctomycetales bacterium]
MTGVRRRKILAVDHNPYVLQALERVLRRRHTVVLAESAADALAQAESERPDLAIIDVMTPKRNGYELMREMRERLPGLDVILMTGNMEDPDQAMIRALDEGAFYFILKPFDRRVLLSIVERCFEIRSLREETDRHVRRMQRELEEAQRFQQSLLPKPETKPRGVSIHADYIPCTELAGDFYDYADSPDAIALLITDVSGKGTSAAIITGLVKTAFHTAREQGYHPTAVVNRVRDAMRDLDERRYVTLVSAVIDRKTLNMTYVNAGHHPFPILRRTGEDPIRLESTGPPIGPWFDEAVAEGLVEYETASVALRPGDSLFFHTDGVIEACRPLPSPENGRTMELFGMDRLVDLVVGSPHRGEKLIREVLDAVTEFSAGQPSEDDVTVMVVDLPETA